jgi:serine phosphatase RsbU (regulator of sigma subunit)
MAFFDTDRRYLRLNDLAARLIGMEEAKLQGQTFPFGSPDGLDESGAARALREVVETGNPIRFETYMRGPHGVRERAWSLELWPVRDAAGEMYAIGVAGFDNSEQYWARQRLAILDEAAVSIGTSLDLETTARELTELVVPRIADFAGVDLLADVILGEEPAAEDAETQVALRRVAHRSIAHDIPDAAIGLGATHPHSTDSPAAQALRTGQPVLRGPSPGPRRWEPTPDWAVQRRGEAAASLLAVPLIARETTLGVAVLVRTRADPFDGDDVSLARELASRAAVCIDNARRYTHERSTALALQASLLPHRQSPQSAVDVACRYRPADSRAGVGGDWFDIIPLSGARVGLVVGDVVGHGIRASATMGRLRTAVRTLADVDLPPDELLAHLDDLVLRLSGEHDENGDETGATCLYAVYDPVSRTLTAATAGHPPPVLVSPDGATQILEMSAGPVLGVGGLPFEAVELEIPEGSHIALYSDGLVEGTAHDPELGIERLRGILSGSRSTLEEHCDRVLEAMVPEHPSDDIAFVLARTRALHADRVHTWDLPADAEVVGEIRHLATDQLDAWGLGESGFVTELVVSELVTNAIRYGAAPIRLRLIYDRTLICEVADANPTSPHLRRARVFDEGGRGLLLVAQLTNNWGTRHTPAGKVIWAEQSLAGMPSPCH